MGRRKRREKGRVKGEAAQAAIADGGGKLRHKCKLCSKSEYQPSSLTSSLFCCIGLVSCAVASPLAPLLLPLPLLLRRSENGQRRQHESARLLLSFLRL